MIGHFLFCQRLPDCVVFVCSETYLQVVIRLLYEVKRYLCQVS
jgi:hypothetical protein